MMMRGGPYRNGVIFNIVEHIDDQCKITNSRMQQHDNNMIQGLKAGCVTCMWVANHILKAQSLLYL